MLIEDVMSKNFSLLPEGLNPEDACERLGAGEFGIIVDEQSSPCFLVTAEDIRVACPPGAGALRELESKLPPAVVVTYERSAPEEAESRLRRLAHTDARGAVIMDALGAVVGVVTLQSVLASNVFDVTSSLLAAGAAGAAAGALAGDPSTAPARIRCLNPACGFVNTVHFLDHNRPPACANPDLTAHELKY